MRDYLKDNVDGSKYGHLSKMTVTSKGMMGSLMVSSFCECINSSTNLVCDFMYHTRLYYPEIIKSTYPTYGTIISTQDILDTESNKNVDDEDM